MERSKYSADYKHLQILYSIIYFRYLHCHFVTVPLRYAVANRQKMKKQRQDGGLAVGGYCKRRNENRRKTDIKCRFSYFPEL